MKGKDDGKKEENGDFSSVDPYQIKVILEVGDSLYVYIC
jgi:hypothetical protein